MADKNSGCESRKHEEEEEEDEEGNPIKQITHKRKCRANSVRGSKNETSDVSMADDSITDDNHKILEGEKSMASLTLQDGSIKEEEEEEDDDDDDDDDDKVNNRCRKKRRTRKKMMKLEDIYRRAPLVSLNTEEEQKKGFEDQGELEEQEDSFIIQQEEQVTAEYENELPDSSPEAEERPQSPLRLFSKILTANETIGTLHISQDQVEHFPFSADLTAEFFEHHGRKMTLRIVDECGKHWKMMLMAYLDVNRTKSYCINSGWKEFVKAHNLEVGDEIIFYRSPSSKDVKELVIEFIKARIL